MNTAAERCPEGKNTFAFKSKGKHSVLAETLEQYLENISEDTFEDSAKKAEINIKEKDMLYYVKTVCPLCGKRFESPKVRSKYLRMTHMDNDYCKYYDSVNPLNYEVMVCSHCGFAYTEEIQKMRLSDEQRKTIKSRLEKLLPDRPPRDYSGVRNLDQAVETFLLALLALQGKPAQGSTKGMLYLKIAWLYRYKNNPAKESDYIEKALSSLVSAYNNEIFQEIQKELNITYLIAVLYFRTGRYYESARWLERILLNRHRPVHPIVSKQAGELWDEVRQMLRENNQQLKNRC
ncbi:DUF2225 domain-containing protein [Pelotomaculum terephthalicicum JT]|uniref:DUF2225 domain-containing protein n=1 Tax=Pelotomaculum TaxID=191373 RepID=UPI0009D1670E|nr:MULTISPECIES: DUF2225 domain-containing protein [Pelotomaculum]MCG9967249.1 DUF2225 domain-containing protein [Pelotomaculum terephthalicicum JT]OPX88650.1 MAG: hypothetical protein A4E54_01249 [Pelotomaculum sp. PtaB.Bin117]OPY63574.1 MAG: hypothetical protein A4E56_00453 [Pelotomaculum sp. PtaU1.Bin065]